MRRVLSILLASTIVIGCSSYNKDKTPALGGEYFGEKPPGLVPKLFDPKIVSPDGRFEGGSFSPDMK